MIMRVLLGDIWRIKWFLLSHLLFAIASIWAAINWPLLVGLLVLFSKEMGEAESKVRGHADDPDKWIGIAKYLTKPFLLVQWAAMGLGAMAVWHWWLA